MKDVLFIKTTKIVYKNTILVVFFNIIYKYLTKYAKI